MCVWVAGWMARMMFGMAWWAMVLVFAGTAAPRGEVASTREPEQVGRNLVLGQVLEEKDVADQVRRIHEAGARVFPAIGRLFKEGGEFEPTLFLFVRDAGYFYRAWYLKMGPAATPVVVMALPGGLKEIGLEKLVKP